jgi:hypothetical protein
MISNMSAWTDVASLLFGSIFHVIIVQVLLVELQLVRTQLKDDLDQYAPLNDDDHDSLGDGVNDGVNDGEMDGDELGLLDVDGIPV